MNYDIYVPCHEIIWTHQEAYVAQTSKLAPNGNRDLTKTWKFPFGDSMRIK